MRKIRLFILIFAMLISLALVGCDNDENTLETELYEEFETEIETEAQIQREGELERIKASIAVKHSEKEISVYSDTTCLLNLIVTIDDGEFTSKNSYAEFVINEGKTTTLTIEDLAPDFFSDEATIEGVFACSPHIYGESSISEDNYTKIANNLLIKFSKKEITIYSDTSCLFDLCLYIEDSDFSTSNDFRKLEISEGETITFTLEDLAPGFFSDTAIIVGYNPYECISYVEND